MIIASGINTARPSSAKHQCVKQFCDFFFISTPKYRLGILGFENDGHKP